MLFQESYLETNELSDQSEKVGPEITLTLADIHGDVREDSNDDDQDAYWSSASLHDSGGNANPLPRVCRSESDTSTNEATVILEESSDETITSDKMSQSKVDSVTEALCDLDIAIREYDESSSLDSLSTIASRATVSGIKKDSGYGSQGILKVDQVMKMLRATLTEPHAVSRKIVFRSDSRNRMTRSWKRIRRS